MSDPNTPLDWATIFDRAHRRLFGRLLLLGGVGALCAVLLLGGGLSARGAVRWRIGPLASAKATTSTAGRVKIAHKVKRQAAARARGGNGSNSARHHAGGHDSHHHHHHHHPSGGGGGGGGTEACPVGQIDSSGKQYEEWILTATGECVLVPVESPDGSGGKDSGGGTSFETAPAG